MCVCDLSYLNILWPQPLFNSSSKHGLGLLSEVQCWTKSSYQEPGGEGWSSDPNHYTVYPFYSSLEYLEKFSGKLLCNSFKKTPFYASTEIEGNMGIFYTICLVKKKKSVFIQCYTVSSLGRNGKTLLNSSCKPSKCNWKYPCVKSFRTALDLYWEHYSVMAFLEKHWHLLSIVHNPESSQNKVCSSLCKFITTVLLFIQVISIHQYTQQQK